LPWCSVLDSKQTRATEASVLPCPLSAIINN
jgi:hypothetical protein